MIDPLTLNQLQSLRPFSRPLLICDVDEVILHLVAPFVQLLGERDMELRKKVVRLTGNVFHKSDGREADQTEIWSILNQLFEQQATRQQAVDGAAQVLDGLSADVDIVLLTNLPHEYGDTRRKYLTEIDIPYPLVTNSGAKGPPVKWLAKRCARPVAFIDDTDHHLQSVREFAPEIHLVHFMADDGFREITHLNGSVLLSTGNWHEAGQVLGAALIHTL